MLNRDKFTALPRIYLNLAPRKRLGLERALNFDLLELDYFYGALVGIFRQGKIKF